MSDLPPPVSRLDGVLVEPAGAWVPRQDAPARLGISERTLDRRLRSGQLRRRQTASGGVEVFVPATPASLSRQVAAPPPETPPLLAAALEIAHRQHDAMLATLLAQQETIGTLRAELAAVLAARDQPPPPRPDTVWSWWRRLLQRRAP